MEGVKNAAMCLVFGIGILFANVIVFYTLGKVFF